MTDEHALPGHHRLVAVGIVIALLSGVGCAAPGEEQPPESESDGPTWHRDIAPLVATHCVHCHSEGNMAPFSLRTYAETKALATWVGNILRAGTMPPWQPEPDEACEAEIPLRDQTSLADDQIDTWRDWARDGAPEGDPATAAPVPDPVDRSLSDWTRRIERPAQLVSEEGEGYQCFLLDPGFEETTWITAAQIEPDALDLLHHVWVWIVPPEEVAAVELRTADDDSFECFGTFGIDPWQLVMVWLPDTMPLELPPGSGLRVEPGSRIVEQVHYHGWGGGGTDSTGVALRTTTEQPARTAEFRFIGNAPSAPVLQPGPNDDGPPRFFVPAFERLHTESMREEIGAGEGPYEVFGVTARMNSAGVNISVSMEDTEGQSASLHRIRDWDLDWQRQYMYDLEPGALPVLGPGDTVTVDCEFDNTVSNVRLRELLLESGLSEPVDMELGSGHLDEMCVGVLGLLGP